jgi:hypothetical protein
LKTFVLSNSNVQPSEYAKLEKASVAGDLTGVNIECPPVPEGLKYTIPEGVSHFVVIVIVVLMSIRTRSLMRGTTLIPMTQRMRVRKNNKAGVVLGWSARTRR